jgi:large subunit ribosomal protein L13
VHGRAYPSRAHGRVAREFSRIRDRGPGGCRKIGAGDSGLTDSRKDAYYLGLPLQDLGGKGTETMRTYVATPKTVARRWHVIDAEGRVLGRVATAAAKMLQGKHKATYTPFIDTGDHVVIVNAAKVKLTGRKEDQKLYRYHSGYEGGLREERAKIVRQKNPARLVEEAVRGMLPKNAMGDAMYTKLKVYADGKHPHAAQQPTSFEVA